MPSLALRAMFKISKLFKLTIFFSLLLPLSLYFFLAKGGGQLPPLPPLGSALVCFTFIPRTGVGIPKTGASFYRAQLKLDLNDRQL